MQKSNSDQNPERSAIFSGISPGRILNDRNLQLKTILYAWLSVSVLFLSREALNAFPNVWGWLNNYNNNVDVKLYADFWVRFRDILLVGIFIFVIFYSLDLWKKTKQSVELEFSSLFSKIGISATAPLLLSLFGIHLAAPYNTFACILVWLLLPGRFQNLKFWKTFGFIFLVLGIWLAAFKGPPWQDEISFWNTATQTLLTNGLMNYVGTFSLSTYPPLYALAGQLFTGVPYLIFGPFALLALPAIYGGLLFTFIFQVRGRLLKTIVFALFFSNSWIRTIFFQAWLGETLSIVILLSLFLSFDIYREKPTNSKSKILLATETIGLGFLIALHKPPLQALFFPAVLPCLFLSTFLVPAQSRSLWIKRLFLLAGATLLAKFAWSNYLAHHGSSGFSAYSKSVGDLKTFSTDVIFDGLLPYIFKTWKIMWVSFIFCVLLWSRLPNWKQALMPLFISVGTCLAVLLLYGTLWSDMEFESAGRYWMPGMMAWIFFVLHKNHNYLAGKTLWTTTKDAT